MDHLIARLRKFRDDRDWSRFHTPKDLALSVSVEAGELLEAFQWRSDSRAPDDALRRAVADEAADVLLYLLLLCDGLGVDLAKAAGDKIDRNEERFPVETSRGVAKPEDQRT